MVSKDLRIWYDLQVFYVLKKFDIVWKNGIKLVEIKYHK